MERDDLAADQRYLRAALTNQYNVILGVGAVAFSAALASWLPLLVGLIAEGAWLFVGPRLDSFRRHADALAVRAETARAIASLSAEHAASALSVERVASQIEALCAVRHDLSPDQKREISSRTRAAVQAFLGACAAHQQLSRVSVQAALAELQAELASLHASLSVETDLGVRASMRRASSVAERRIQQLEGHGAAVRSVELALQTFQRSLAMLEEGAAGLSSGPELCAELDTATAQLLRSSAPEVEREAELGAGRPSVLPPALSRGA